MKRKYGDRADWARILEHTFTVAQVDLPAYHGVVTLYSIGRVREPLYKTVAGDLTLIADEDFRWLQFYSAYPASQTYTVTASFDPHNDIAQWYIDVCAGHGGDWRGIPWHDDLYLDLVVNPRGKLAVLDSDELDDAADAGVVDAAAYTLVWREAHRLAPLAHRISLPEMCVAREALDVMCALERGEVWPGFARLEALGGAPW
jgi:predicted RNA-binding protein associated with RNAse of E/G family